MKLRTGRLAAPLLGLALAPAAAGSLMDAGRALGALTLHPEASAWFLLGFGAYGCLHLLDVLRWRKLYVLAHEMTHALAAWMSGAKVLGLSVRKDSGHVDLSHVNAFTALAPYWLPLYSLLLAAGYRIALWVGPPRHAREAFLILMGASLAFHLFHTAQSLWARHQSDLEHAGIMFSLSSIVLFNGVLMLVAFKCLFPGLIALPWAFADTWGFTRDFWGGCWIFLRRAHGS